MRNLAAVTCSATRRTILSKAPSVRSIRPLVVLSLYPSVEEKAAMLLYLVTKNHSFSDGNKRIAATLFLWFLNNNGILYNEDGSKRIADNTLVALTLMIAESRTEEKDTMVKVVVNLINKNN